MKKFHKVLAKIKVASHIRGPTWKVWSANWLFALSTWKRRTKRWGFRLKSRWKSVTRMGKYLAENRRMQRRSSLETYSRGGKINSPAKTGTRVAEKWVSPAKLEAFFLAGDNEAITCALFRFVVTRVNFPWSSAKPFKGVRWISLSRNFVGRKHRRGRIFARFGTADKFFPNYGKSSRTGEKLGFCSRNVGNVTRSIFHRERSG